MPTEIVPFGKYKGQPIETLQQVSEIETMTATLQ